MKLVIAESFRRFFELNRTKSKVAQILVDDVYTTTEFGNYIARRGDMISFLPAGKEHMVNEEIGRWKRENRQTAKAGKLARKLIIEAEYDNLELKDTDFELFSNLIKADKINDEDCQVKFIEVRGKDIRYRYHEDNHSSKYSLGSMGDSCMRYDSCQSYLDIYVYNENVVSLLVMVDDNNDTVGRAIVWQIDKGVFMDRVYASDAHQKMFENYADNKGWLYKEDHNNDQTTHIVKDGVSELRYMVVQLDKWEFDEYPYMDTLSYLNDNGKISNDSDYNNKELRETDGRICGENEEEDHEGQVYCEWSEEYIDEDNAVYIDGYGSIHERYARYDDYKEEYIKDSDSQRLENGKYCHENDAVETEDGWYYKDDLDDFEYINGKYYNREDDCVLDELTDEYIPYDKSVCLVGGSRTHEDGPVVLLDASYGEKLYARKTGCFECPYSDTWFLVDGSIVLYSGTRVSDKNMEKYLEDNPEEINPAHNQLTLEIQ